MARPAAGWGEDAGPIGGHWTAARGAGRPRNAGLEMAARPPPAKAGLARAAEAPAAAISTPLPQGPFYWALTSIFFCCCMASAVFGKVSVVTPFLKLASILSRSTPCGIAKLRRKLP